MIFLLFFCALLLSGTAAYYSIVGLMAIFAAAPIPIAIMGSILEGSKLVIASWLYRNWKAIPRLFKGYFTVALFILMFLTSMGIFGFLSKAHIDQGIPSAGVAAEVALLDDKIKIEQENLDAARKTLSQLDQQVDQTLARTTDARGTDRSVAIRRNQTRDRTEATKSIRESQQRIMQLTEARAPKAAELRKVEAEVGPIKYIAALIYGEEANQDQTLLEKSVRWVIILIVAVFDPLAVTMLMAANWSQIAAQQKNVTPERPSEPQRSFEPEEVEEPKHPPVEVAEDVNPEPTNPEPQTTSEEHPVFRGYDNVWKQRTSQIS